MFILWAKFPFHILNLQFVGFFLIAEEHPVCVELKVETIRQSRAVEPSGEKWEKTSVKMCDLSSEATNLVIK